MTAVATLAWDRAKPAIREEVASSQLVMVLPFGAVTGFEECLRTIEELSRLPFNWDSYGSPPVQSAAVHGALQVLLAARANEQSPAPRVVPVSGGGLQLEWRIGGRELDVEILPDGSMETLTVNEGEIREDQLPTAALPVVVPMLIHWLSGETIYAAAIR